MEVKTYWFEWTQADILYCDARQILDPDVFLAMIDEMAGLTAGRGRVAVLLDRSGAVVPLTDHIVEGILTVYNRLPPDIGYLITVGGPMLTRLAFPLMRRLYNINVDYAPSREHAERMAQTWLESHPDQPPEDGKTHG